MPTFHRLDAAQVDALRPKRREPEVPAEYAAFLGTLKNGDWATVTATPTEPQRTVKRLVNLAAGKLGLTLTWRRNRVLANGSMLFVVGKRSRRTV